MNWRAADRFGLDYAKTLRCWRARFEHAAARGLLPAGFDDRFQRLWRYYLTYCEGGFRAGGIDAVQLLLEKPAA
ncbi:class I SAM-dependent methyltransferase [Hankyongella ginsenosidimutans]|uniref:class I SAM-dependent methyltransferase n=1 Tax=Hankyongella ginsenosidimutans TaxID=1763828 RepID=UPI00319DCCD2